MDFGFLIYPAIILPIALGCGLFAKYYYSYKVTQFKQMKKEAKESQSLENVLEDYVMNADKHIDTIDKIISEQKAKMGNIDPEEAKKILSPLEQKKSMLSMGRTIQPVYPIIKELGLVKFAEKKLGTFLK